MMFITFEGIDQSGKTSCVKLLYEKMLSANYAVCWTREPGGDPFGEDIRNLVLTAKQKQTHINPWADTLLFIAARKQHVEHVILPALQNHQIVLCERFIDSTIAYQSYGLGIDATSITNIHQLINITLQPTLTFLIVTDLDINFQRIKDINIYQKHRFEHYNKTFFKKVLHGYLALAKANPERIIIMYNNQSTVTELVNKIYEMICHKLTQ